MTLFDLDKVDRKPARAAGIDPAPRDEMPLAARMRPRDFDEFAGQEHLVGKGRVLRNCIEADKIPSMVFWGPPGSGKTTLAFLIASLTRSFFVHVSAVSAGVAELRQAVEEARQRLKASGQRTILFIDEIHRFSKSQQDAVLPFVENGVVTFIGATTENPSFEVIAPLLSRSRVFTLNALTEEQVVLLARRALADKERGLGNFPIHIDDDAVRHLAVMANGDARSALNTLEMAVQSTRADEKGSRSINLAVIEDVLQRRSLLYDKNGEQHYDIISALHKSLRGSDPDAGLYWLGRMLEAGEDPLYVARRLVRFASEDVGLADPQALVLAMAAQQAVHFIGLPEGNLALAELVVYLAAAPKSNSLYTAYSAVRKDVERSRNDPVPLHLRNPVTSLMKNLDYGKDYKYPHDHPGHFIREQYLPAALKDKTYYRPSDQGQERDIAARLKAWWGSRREKKE